jgi:hypothetical protein
VIAYLVTTSDVSLDMIQALLSKRWSNIRRQDAKLFLMGPLTDQGGHDSLWIQEMTRELALEEWEPDNPLMDQLFSNPLLQETTRAYYVTLSTTGLTNRLFPEVVHLLRDAGLSLVILTHYGAQFTADQFLDTLARNPDWKWEYTIPTA